MTPDEFKNHALFAGGIGAFVRLAVVKPKSIVLAIVNVLIGGACSWFFSPLIMHYFSDIAASPTGPHISGAVSFTIGFLSLWILSYVAELMNESKGNPISVWIVMKNQIKNIGKPPASNDSPNTNPTNTNENDTSK